jgi:hypothetical protein
MKKYIVKKIRFHYRDSFFLFKTKESLAVGSITGGSDIVGYGIEKIISRGNLHESIKFNKKENNNVSFYEIEFPTMLFSYISLSNCEIMEFPDDKSAELWFKLEYGY